MTTNLSSFWGLDPSVAYLSHGTFGACPSAVLQAQTALRLEMERELVDFLDLTLPARLDAARQTLATFLGAEAADLVFVPQRDHGRQRRAALARVRARRRAAHNHPYLCRLPQDASTTSPRAAGARRGRRAACHFRCAGRRGRRVGRRRVSPRTRLALLDHVTSPTALVLPVARLVAELRDRGIETLVDGAHAPGMVPLALAELGAAYYTGNAHKWLCAPKGAAFLHVRRDRQAGCTRRDQPRLQRADFRPSSTGPARATRRRGCAFLRRSATWADCSRAAGPS